MEDGLINYITWDIVPWMKRMGVFYNGTNKTLSYSTEQEKKYIQIF